MPLAAGRPASSRPSQTTAWGPAARAAPSSRVRTRRPSADHTLSSQRKGYKRFVTEDTLSLRQAEVDCQEKERVCQSRLHKLVFAKYTGYCDAWKEAVRVLSELDCLMALQKYR